jgi:hypothetical protein
MSNIGLAAEPMSAKAIWEVARRVRSILGLKDVMYFPIVHVIELALPRVLPEFELEILDDADLPYAYAEALPDVPAMRIRGTVYERAVSGHYRDRFTLAHELAHLVLHSEQRLQRAVKSGIPIYRDPEWQANTFAAELLMPVELYKKVNDPEEAKAAFGISALALKVQLAALQRNGLL